MGARHGALPNTRSLSLNGTRTRQPRPRKPCGNFSGRSFQHILQLPLQIHPVEVWRCRVVPPAGYFLALQYARHVTAGKQMLDPAQGHRSEERVEVWRHVQQHVDMRAVHWPMLLYPGPRQAIAAPPRPIACQLHKSAGRSSVLTVCDSATLPKDGHETVEWPADAQCPLRSIDQREALGFGERMADPVGPIARAATPQPACVVPGRLENPSYMGGGIAFAAKPRIFAVFSNFGWIVGERRRTKPRKFQRNGRG